MKRLFTVACLVLALQGCAEAPLNTPSGRPQAFFADQSMATMQNVLVDMAAHVGMTITTQTPNTVTMEKPMGFRGSLLMGEGAQRQLTFTLVRRRAGTEVFVSEAYLENPGTPMQQIDPDTDSNRSLQDLLMKMQAAAAEGRGPFAHGG